LKKKASSRLLPLAFTRRSFFASPLAFLIPRLNASPTEYRSHHDHVLGTSLDLVVYGASRESEAAAVHAAVFEELARLSNVLSTYDSSSEISRFNARGGRGSCSQDLFQVLAAYDTWQRRTSGAVSARIGAMGALLNVDALGKAHIADRAVDAALQAAPGIAGLLLNIGGDIVVRGEVPQTIGVADPAARADNARPVTSLRLANRAVATSGTSERGHHILDPRTGSPATGANSATVIACDSVTANALATALCVLTPEEGLRLVDRTPDSAAILSARDGSLLRSLRFAAYEQPIRVIPVQAAAHWQSGYEVAVTLTLKEIQGYRVRRPYIAVWAEDSAGKLVRNIAVWANKPRWLPELRGWWARNGGTGDLFSLTKPTRPPGRYRILWDGRDDHGNPVPAGLYRIVVETSREHGGYFKQGDMLDCGGKPARITLKETSDSEEVLIEYGPRSQAL
jgi:thiamine biosynthesis lipoprotein ApbE